MIAKIETLSALQQRLIKGLELLPDDISLCLLNGKKIPQGKEWQKRPYRKEKAADAIAHGLELENSEGKKYRAQPQGYGLMAGLPITVNGEQRYLLIVDQDGASAKRKIEEMSGSDIPQTVMSTSGRKDRCHRIYYVTEEYAPHLQSKTLATGEIGEDGKPEHVEFLWLGRQAVLPPSVHPTTGEYTWITSPKDIEIAPAPTWVIEQMLKPQAKTTPQLRQPTTNKWSSVDWALSYLNALSPYRTDDYDDWLTVGMALHSVDDSLLTEWDKWSQQSPKYTPGCCEQKWKSFKKDGKSLGSLGHMAKQDGWRSPFEKSSSGRGYSGNRRSFGGNGGNGGDGGNESKILQFPGGDGSPLAFVKQVLSETKSKSERDSAFVSSRYNPRDLQAIAREVEREEDIAEEQQEAKEALPRLLQKPSLDPRDYLWGDDGRLAQAIVDTANAMPANPSKLFTTLVPVAATLIGTSSRIVVKPSAKYAQPCIFNTGNVDPTGSNKSGTQGAITSPLTRLEIEANQRYQAELENYNIEFARWKKRKGDPEDEPKKPTRKRYLTKDSTIATLERIHGENPRGILVNAEELVGDFKRENAYNGGRGADRESKLDQWNGSAFITDRAERTVVLERTAISRTGTIQLETLQSLFRDASIFDSGVIPRWLFDAASSPPRFIEFDDAPDTGIDDLLTQLYKRLEKMPQADYLLSAEAKPVFRDWQHSLVRRTIAEDGAIKQILPKIEAYTARFALWLHVVNAALAEVTPPPTISALTMSRAVALAQYYLKQWEFILAINSPDLSLTGILLKMYEHIKSKPNGVKISLLKSGIRALRSTDKKEVHNHCMWLVNNGYAVITNNIITILQKDGGDRVYDIYDNFMTPCHKAQSTIQQGLDKIYDTYDTKTEVAEVLPGTNEVHHKVETPPPENVICHKSDVLVPETTVAQSVDTHDTGVINTVMSYDACHEMAKTDSKGGCFPGSSPNAHPLEMASDIALGNGFPQASPSVSPAEVEETDEAAALTRMKFLIDSLQEIAEKWDIEELEQLRNEAEVAEIAKSELNVACKRLQPRLHARIKQMILVLSKPNARIQYKEYSGSIAARAKGGKFFINWDNSSQRIAHQNKYELPGVLEVSEFSLA